MCEGTKQNKVTGKVEERLSFPEASEAKVSFSSWVCVDDGIGLRLGNFRGFGKLELIRLKGQAIAWLMGWHGAAAHPCVIR